MSWIFSFLLGCYAMVRVVLWIRGQWRWRSLRSQLPELPREVPPPPHLARGLARTFAGTRTLRVRLGHSRHLLAAVAVTDPDVPLGSVRDIRYRRALIESWSHLRIWLREWDELDDEDLRALADMGLSNRTIADLREALRPQWSAVSNARALDPFPLDDLERARAILDRADTELIGIENALTRSGEDPYRDRWALA